LLRGERTLPSGSKSSQAALVGVFGYSSVKAAIVSCAEGVPTRWLMACEVVSSGVFSKRAYGPILSIRVRSVQIMLNVWIESSGSQTNTATLLVSSPPERRDPGTIY